MRQITKQDIKTEYAALVEIVRVIRAAGTVNADAMYEPYRQSFPREDFNRIINVLERCNQVVRHEDNLIWNRRVN